jgi:hypothetical protein
MNADKQTPGNAFVLSAFIGVHQRPFILLYALYEWHDRAMNRRQDGNGHPRSGIREK